MTSSVMEDVVIVGGGPAGLSVLAALKNSPKTRHLKCTLVEASDLTNVRDFYDNPGENYTNRVVSVTPKSVEFMKSRIGNWDYMKEDRVKFYDRIVAYDSQDNDNARIDFDAGSTESGVLAAMIENINIQSSLLKKIEEINDTEGTTVLDKTKVEDIISPIQQSLEDHDLNEIDPNAGNADLDWPIVKLSNGDIIQTRLLIGADGYNSPVRKFARIESRGWQYNRFGVVGTLKMEYEDYRSVGWQRFLTTGPLAILPLTEDNATMVWSSTPKLSEILLKTNKEIFPHLVNAATVLDEADLNYIYKLLDYNPDDMAVIDEIKWRLEKFDQQNLEENYPLKVVEVLDGSRARFPLKLSHADTYIAPRIALIGDAAHTIHPLAGQGLNMGQSDVAALMTALESGIDRGMDIGSTLVLDSYVANSWPSNHMLLGICDKLHKVFATDYYPVVALRGLGLKSLNVLESFKDIMVKIISAR
ncbi:COQ6 monooxygenase, coenzyme Q biosynthesis [Scheffersomyces amazonensis]|uniref:COQ6 monooxygenase, coenzyme Q biosynthesis n=1 Tax=Scheffersomyces amazonensis TaxID=1078765 RepID=UPI00315CE393